MADLLLLNASNFPGRPIYPYAFVQLRALGRLHGLHVVTAELLSVPTASLTEEISRLLSTWSPRAIGLHLGQLDSLDERDYRLDRWTSDRRGFYPVLRTREVVEVVRNLTTIPIIAGGIGFSSEPERLFEYLGVDLGVRGDADDFMREFDDAIARRRLAMIPGLVYRDQFGVHSNPVAWHEPARFPEYDDAAVLQIRSFYGEQAFRGAHPPQAAVEIMRGCPFRCYFCVEPHAKGRLPRERNLEAVRADVRFLVDRGFCSFWLVCSELNARGPSFGRRIAKLFLELRAEYPDTSITWSAYTLPTLNPDDLKLLVSSGFLPRVNDALSLDDENLKAAGVPYRGRHVVRHLHASRELDAIRATPEGRHIAFMLGNLLITHDTIAKTLAELEAAELLDAFDDATVIDSTRVFGFMHDKVDIRAIRNYEPSVNEPSVSDSPRFIMPSFASSPILLELLGTIERIREFFAYVEDVILSSRYRRARKATHFLQSLVSAYGELDVRHVMGVVFDSEWRPLSTERFESIADSHDVQVEAALRSVFWSARGKLKKLAAALGLVVDNSIQLKMTSYRVAYVLGGQFVSKQHFDAFVEALTERSGKLTVELLFSEWLLFETGVRLEADFSRIICGSAGAPLSHLPTPEN